MLTKTYRPLRIKDIVGQSFAKDVVGSIVRSPEFSPRSLIFSGGRGLGKTSLARCFSRALLCESRSGGDACLSCSSCLSFGGNSLSFLELDSTQVGNVEFIRSFRDYLFSTVIEGYRVVVFDECHVISHQAQSVLLRLLEEGPRNTFFILCTTDDSALIETIKSRCITLSFFPVSDEELRGLLLSISKKEGKEVSEDIVNSIVLYSDGYVRDAVMKLSLYFQVGEELFKSYVIDVRSDIIKALEICVSVGSSDELFEVVKRISSVPLVVVKKSMERVVLDILDCSVRGNRMNFPVKLVDRKLAMELLSVLARDWVVRCFESDVMFSSFMFYLYSYFKGSVGSVRSGYASYGDVSSRFRKG